MATPNLELNLILITDKIRDGLLSKVNDNMEKIDSAFGELKSLLLIKTGKSTLAEAIAFVDELVNTEDSTADATKIFNGFTAYAGNEKITGTGLSDAITATLGDISNGKTAYNESGAIITGTLADKKGITQTADGSVIETDYLLKVPEAGHYDTDSYLKRAKSSVLTDLGAIANPVSSFVINGTYANSTYYTEGGSGYAVLPNGDVVIFIQGGTSASYEHVYFNANSLEGATAGVGFGVNVWDTSDPTQVVYACTLTGVSAGRAITVALDNVNSSYDYVRANITVANA